MGVRILKPVFKGRLEIFHRNLKVLGNVMQRSIMGKNLEVLHYYIQCILLHARVEWQAIEKIQIKNSIFIFILFQL